jgi:maltooligosyltrehalose trehalohydrolase
MELSTFRRSGPLTPADGSVCWRVWAPHARAVELVLVDGARRHGRPMAPEGNGYFCHCEAGIAEGQCYAYRLDGGPERADPASPWQPEGVEGPSAVVRPERFAWSDAGWTGVFRQDLVFYELHVGTFTPEGTFDAVIPRLESLRRLGVTAIELMPVAQFPGTRNWGYDGVFLYAPQNSYGGPHGLQRLVDACHRAGLAVFLDVVYNHVGPEGNYLQEFGPYFADRYRTFWGPAFNYDSAGCDPVRDFVIDNARMWVGEYHVDGLRLDAVHAIYDFGPRHILRALKEGVDEVGRRQGRPVHVIAESDLNDVRLLLPPERGGLGLDAQWSDDLHHALHAYLTGERQDYYADFGPAQHLAKALMRTFVYDGIHSVFRNRRHGGPVGDLTGDRFVVAIQNHDQVGNRARGDRLSTLLPPPALRLAGSLLLLSPHLPLIFMGEEYGEENPFQFFCSFCDHQLRVNVREGRRAEFRAFAWQGQVPDPHEEATFAASRVSWDWSDPHRAGVRRLYADLLAARRAWPALADYTHRSARVLPDEDTRAILEFVRGEAGKAVHVCCNLTAERQAAPGPASGEALLFSSESAGYQGERTQTDSLAQLLPHECLVFGPAGWERFC